MIVGTHNNGDRTGNKIYFLRSDTGQVVWSTTPGNLDQVNGTAIVDYSNNTVWLASLSNSSTQPSLWKLSTTSGAVLSAITLPTSNKDVGGSPILNFNSAAPYLYLVTNGGDIVAVNTTNNAVTVGSNYGSGLVKNPFVLRNAARTGDEIYFSNSGGVYKALFSYAGGFSSDPNLVWSSNVVPSPSTPVPDHYPTPTALYVGGNDGKLYKLNASDGTQADVRTVNAGGSLIGDASVDIQLSKIYVGDSSGRIYSYDIF